MWDCPWAYKNMGRISRLRGASTPPQSEEIFCRENSLKIRSTGLYRIKIAVLLPWLILIPFIGGFLCWRAERFGVKVPRWIALVTHGIDAGAVAANCGLRAVVH